MSSSQQLELKPPTGYISDPQFLTSFSPFSHEMFLLFWTFKKNPEPSSVATKLKYKILKTEFSIPNARVFVFVKSAKLFFKYDCFYQHRWSRFHVVMEKKKKNGTLFGTVQSIIAPKYEV